jgi:flagellar motility protein MotE (MotC chaperone)
MIGLNFKNGITKRVRAKPTRSVLMILALFLASSGALRLGSGLGAAFANVSKEEEVQAVETAVQCAENPLELANALSVREEKIRAREAALEDRIAALDLAGLVIEQRLTEMAESEVALKSTLALADGAAENDLAQLTAVYEAMKPADAAKLFGTMAPDFAAGFLGRMTPAAAAAVMAGIAPAKAYEISALLAGRNALAPKQ